MYNLTIPQFFLPIPASLFPPSLNIVMKKKKLVNTLDIPS